MRIATANVNTPTTIKAAEPGWLCFQSSWEAELTAVARSSITPQG